MLADVVVAYAQRLFGACFGHIVQPIFALRRVFDEIMKRRFVHVDRRVWHRRHER